MEELARKFSFGPRCPLCGNTGHKQYVYEGKTLLVCPKAEKDKVYFYEYDEADLYRINNYKSYVKDTKRESTQICNVLRWNKLMTDETTEQRINDIGNLADDPDARCGLDIDGVPVETPFSDKDTSACAVHDNSYSILRGQPQEVLNKVNYNLWYRMVEINNTLPWYRKLYELPKAFLFEGLVQAFGWIPWRSEAPMTPTDPANALNQQTLEEIQAEKEGITKDEYYNLKG